MALHQSGEDYLKTILLLHKELQEVRAVDIAQAMGYSKASVSRMMKILNQLQYVNITENSIDLTAEGKVRANEIYMRYCVVRDFLIFCLAVTPATAEKDACRMEHTLSNESFNALKTQLENNKKYF